MTMTSFIAPQAGYAQPVSTRSHGETPGLNGEKDPKRLHHFSEVQRMKDFAGRQRFQAPVADDFARGMLAPGQDVVAEKPRLAQLHGVLIASILGFKALCTTQCDGDHKRDALKVD